MSRMRINGEFIPDFINANASNREQASKAVNARNALSLNRFILSVPFIGQATIQRSFHLRSPFCYRLKLHPVGKLPHTPTLEPLVQILALADIERFQLVAAIHNGLHTDTCYSYAAAYRELMKLK